MRRRLLPAVFAGLLTAVPALAADPLRLVSGFAPGGPTDTLVRAMLPALTRELGRPVVVETRSGASATIAAATVARAAPDGNTLLIGTSSLVITAATMPGLSYDPRRDFEPLHFMGEVQTLLIARQTLGVTSLAELVALTRGRRQMSYASAGVGSTMHIAGELFNSAAGAQVTHVPYRGVPPAMADLMGGVVDFLNADLPVLRPFVLERRVVPLVIYGPNRSPQLPDVPSSVEAGMPELNMQNWYGILAPVGIPRPLFGQLEAAFNKARVDPEAAARFDEGGVGAPMSAAAFATRLDGEFGRWLPLIRRLGIKVE